MQEARQMLPGGKFSDLLGRTFAGSNGHHRLEGSVEYLIRRAAFSVLKLALIFRRVECAARLSDQPIGTHRPFSNPLM